MINTLSFNVNNNLFNKIQVNTNNQMLMYSNNINWLKSDGELCNIFSDLKVFSNTASAIKRFTIESAGTSGTPYLTLKARSLSQGPLYLTNTALYLASETSGVSMSFTTNNNGTIMTPLNLYPNGVIDVGDNVLANKKLVLFDSAESDAPSTATNFFGFGINTGAMRYQVNTTSNSHKFYCGSTLAYTISSTGGANGSDIRFKKEIQNITGALDKINQIQGKTFLMHDNPNRQMGFIAQEIKDHIPECVFVDTSDENNYHYVQYDKITAILCEGIKELMIKLDRKTDEISELKNRLKIIEQKLNI